MDGKVRETGLGSVAAASGRRCRREGCSAAVEWLGPASGPDAQRGGPAAAAADGLRAVIRGGSGIYIQVLVLWVTVRGAG